MNLRGTAGPFIGLLLILILQIVRSLTNNSYDYWLDRMLASNRTNMELCRRKKQSERRSKIKHFEFRRKLKNKKMFNGGLIWTRRNSKKAMHLRRDKSLRKEQKHKHRSWKSQLKEEWNKKLKNKLKESKFGKYFHKKGPVTPNILSFNTTILKSNSDVEKIFLQRTKNKGENYFKNHQFGNSLIKQVEVCGEGLKCKEKTSKGPDRESRNLTMMGRWSEEVKSMEEGHEAKMPKRKPWPHFVYHRVSSNSLHPDSGNLSHRQSAYIAISVVTSSKPDSTDNNDVI